MRFLKIFIISTLALTSCSTEKLSVSPISESLAKSNSTNYKYIPEKLTDRTGRDFYSAELSNQISSFPKFQNSSLNAEIAKLKYYVKEYIYAVQAYNLVGQENALNNLEKSYKNIQKLRKFLNPSDDEIINRYLVRIKNNVSQLESLKKDSIK